MHLQFQHQPHVLYKISGVGYSNKFKTSISLSNGTIAIPGVSSIFLIAKILLPLYVQKMGLDIYSDRLNRLSAIKKPRYGNP